MGDDGAADEQSERPRLKQIDHEAPDGTSADGVFDRGTRERDERREAADEEADR